LEFAGVVSSIGGNSKFSVGDRIFGSTQGSFAEKVAVHDTDIFQVPDGWTFSAAAGLSATAPVSYGALIIRGCLKKGETVLIHAAAGGL
jgi:NADPH2:quinone reductase